MIPLKNNNFLILVLAVLVSTGFIERDRIKGEFRFSMWAGPHGSYGKININGTRYTHTHWLTNFFHPTKSTECGQISFTGDSITFTPRKVSFYRRVKINGKNDFKKITCTCDADGLRNIDRDNERFAIESCEPSIYFLSGDTLIGRGGHFNYIRYQKNADE